jgi:hypothetical protein
VSKIVDSSGKAQGLNNNRVENIYINNPDEYMYWPIFQGTLDDSQGTIKNDYGYASK